MTDQDYEGFVREYQRLAAVLDPYKKTPEELKAKADVYFHALKRFQLREVIAKADTWLLSETKMPMPADWAGVVAKPVGADLPVMSDAAAREYRRAELAGYEGEPCSCVNCVQAGVMEKPIRFVPEFDHLDRDRKVRDPILNRIVTAGHWAHGAELARYYTARSNFWNRFYEVFPTALQDKKKHEKEPIEQRLARIFRQKELV